MSLAAGSMCVVTFYRPSSLPPVITPNAASPIVARAAGRVQRVYVKGGDVVRIGDPIVQLDMRALIARKHALEVRIHQAELGSGSSGLSDLYREFHETDVELTGSTITSAVEGRILFVVSFAPGERIQRGSAVAVAVPLPAN